MDRHFFTDGTKRSVADAVGAIEAHTAAEIVVAVRNKGGEYRYADLAFGAAAAFVTLLVLLFYPRPFSVAAMPIDLAVVFTVAALACANSPSLRRLLTRRSVRQENVLAAARAAFVELGVSRTRGRTGVLVFVAVLEREVAVVADIGVDSDGMGAAWREAVASLESAVARVDAPAFVAALDRLTKPLAAALPRAEDDIDELENVPTMA